MSKQSDLVNVTQGTLDVDGGTIKLDGNYPVGTGNVALGDAALDDGSLSGPYNVAIGNNALTSNSSGDRSIAIGGDALASQSTGSTNTAVGNAAMYANSTGSYNVALGGSALSSNTTASNNTVIGHQAGYSNTTFVNNTYIGYHAGYNALGGGNTYLGKGSGVNMTSGQNNTILGSYNGNQNGLDIRTSSNNIVLSDGDGNPRIRVDSNGFIAMGPEVGSIDTQHATLTLRRMGRMMRFEQTYYTDAEAIQFTYNGTAQVGSITTNQSSTSYNTSSDYCLKENVVDLTGATDRLKQLNPSRFNFIADPDTTVDGFLAHEVQTIVPEAIHGTKDEVDADGNPVYQGIDQSKLVPLLVATIKELEARITALEAN